jgi:hypothetical protein
MRRFTLIVIGLLAGLAVAASSGCGSGDGPDREALREARRQGAVAAHRADELRQLKRQVAELRHEPPVANREPGTVNTPPHAEEASEPSTADPRIPASGTYYGLARQRGTPTEVNKDYSIEMTFSSAGSSVAYPTLGCRGSMTPLGFRGDARTYRETIESGHCDSGGIWQVQVDGTTLSAYWELPAASYSVSAVLEGSD